MVTVGGLVVVVAVAVHVLEPAVELKVDSLLSSPPVGEPGR